MECVCLLPASLRDLLAMEVEGKLLQESLSTVKVQLISLRRCLVRSIPSPLSLIRSLFHAAGLGSAHGCAEERFDHARRAQNVFPLPEAVLRTLLVSLLRSRSSAPSLTPATPVDMAVFDALRHLSSYLYDAHVSSRHHLADLYELVQYAGNIVPRLCPSHRRIPVFTDLIPSIL